MCNCFPFLFENINDGLEGYSAPVNEKNVILE